MIITVRERKQIADTILLQLGGTNKLGAMIGASQFSYDDNGNVTFWFKGCRKANIIKVSLNGSDLYNIEFFKFNSRSYECKSVKTFTDVYNSDLQSVIEAYTGLYLSL